MTYNGYRNYETWNVQLWASNEEPSYLYVIENKPYDAEKAKRISLELFPNGTPDMDQPNDMNLVDWKEIAEAFNEY